jgi:signal transduction histidine kinase
MGSKTQLIALIGSDALTRTLAGRLEGDGYRVRRGDGPGEASRLIEQDRPALVIRAAGRRFPTARLLDLLAKSASRLGVPVLDIVEDEADPGLLVDRHGEADERLYRSRIDVELLGRVRRLLGRGASAGAAPDDLAANPIDSKFLALVVHDLRTPLNVVGLSLRMIDQAVPRNDPDLLEDLKFVEENFKQIERMLSQLSDFCRPL